MASSPPLRQLRRRRSPPALAAELIEEILLRLHPDEPADLVRAGLVCKAWRSMVSDAGFLRRYRQYHATPPLLGYLHNKLSRPWFVPTQSTTPVPFSTPAPSSTRVSSWVIGCRHGRVLIYYPVGGASSRRFDVWDPVTGGTTHLVAPSHRHTYSCNAAVLCAARGCDHLTCHGGPFRVVFVETRSVEGGQCVAQATVYSSAAGAWGAAAAAASIAVDHFVSIGRRPSLVIGDALYFTLNQGANGTGVLKYDLGCHALSVVDTTGVPRDAIAIRAEDGGLGFVAVSRYRSHLIILSRQRAAAAAAGGGGGWVRHRAIELGTLIPKSPERPSCRPRVIGYVEGTDTVFLNAHPSIFTLELKSRRLRKLSTYEGSGSVAYTSFYTPDIIAKGRLSRE